MSAYQSQQNPNNPYLTISQAPIKRTLPRLTHIPAKLAEASFRHACGFPPIASTPAVTAWLKKFNPAFAPVVEADLKSCVVLDLSISSPLLKGAPIENTEPQLTSRLFNAITSIGATVGIGQYNEARLLYTEPPFATDDNPLAEHRTIHLGLDLFLPANTPIYAPLSGEIFAYANNTAPQDYGPVILLKHKTDTEIPFYTLYGHLSLTSLDGLQVGQPIAAGQPLATIGPPDVNGGWPPHLHFQLITDLLDQTCDFPGVGLASQREIWQSLSPNPNLILNIPADRFPPPAPDKTETLSTRQQRIGQSLSLAYQQPLKIVRGWMQYLYDETGRRYLDAYNNVPHVGHCHPQVVKAGQTQLAILNTNTRYLHDFINQYAERLCATLPQSLRVCFFVNSGSEANELALRLARTHTGQQDIIVLDASYHGHTSTLIDISPYKHNGPGGVGPPAWVHTAPVPDVYRGDYKRDDPQAGQKYAAHILEIIEALHKKGRRIAGYIAESLPSVGGQLVPPPGYLKAAYHHVRQAGGVCIADDVQTGYGRIGTHFWGFEAQGVTPDIVVLGKPIGNGHPLGVVITTPEIAASFLYGMEFFCTFGGNPVSCAIGLATLEVVQKEGLQAHALRVGEHLLQGLRPLTEQYALVGDVRGSGLFLGVELVRNRETLEPAPEEASFIANRMKEEGILIGTDGPWHNVLKIRPPMPFTQANADQLVATLTKILAQDFPEAPAS